MKSPAADYRDVVHLGWRSHIFGLEATAYGMNPIMVFARAGRGGQTEAVKVFEKGVKKVSTTSTAPHRGPSFVLAPRCGGPGGRCLVRGRTAVPLNGDNMAVLV